MSYIAGLDIGTATSKAVIMNNGSLESFGIIPTEGNFSKAADMALRDALAKVELTGSDIELFGACGLGSSFISYPFTQITEITCHSRGTHYLFPSVRTLIEVGNQASRIIKVSREGKVAGCLVSDKCAAGSGRILQVVAKVLRVDLAQMGELSMKATKPVKFTTGCAVFLETEAISRVAEGMSIENIISGLHHTLAAKISAMAQRMKLEEDCAITGGGAKDIGLVKVMEKKLEKPLLTPDEPIITAAIGAALIASERNNSGQAG